MQRSFEYIVALMEFNMIQLEFQFNHYLYEGFKSELKNHFSVKLPVETDWGQLAEEREEERQRQRDEQENLEKEIQGLENTLSHVKRLRDCFGH